jgi:peroxiredoxin family protein
MSSRQCIVVVSGSREKLQMAAMVASVAAVSGSDVRVFLSMNALPYFVKNAAKHADPEGVVGRLLEQKNVPPFDQLFQQAAELGDAKIYACSMAMDILGLQQEQLEPYVTETMGLTKFLDEAADGQVWSF